MLGCQEIKACVNTKALMCGLCVVLHTLLGKGLVVARVKLLVVARGARATTSALQLTG